MHLLPWEKISFFSEISKAWESVPRRYMYIGAFHFIVAFSRESVKGEQRIFRIQNAKLPKNVLLNGISYITNVLFLFSAIWPFIVSQNKKKSICYEQR